MSVDGVGFVGRKRCPFGSWVMDRISSGVRYGKSQPSNCLDRERERERERGRERERSFHDLRMRINFGMYN